MKKNGDNYEKSTICNNKSSKDKKYAKQIEKRGIKVVTLKDLGIDLQVEKN